MAFSSKFHSALTITNIKSLIPITQDQDSSQYHSQSTLFKIYAQVYNVIDHIILLKDKKSIMLAAKTKAK